MTDQTSFDTATRIAAGDDGTNYDNVAIALHWMTALLVVANFLLAQTWDWVAKPVRGVMEDTHMSFGVLLTAVVATRLVWRLIPGHQMSSLEAGWVRLSSKATHYVLYLLLVAEAALRVSPGAAFYRVEKDGKQIGWEYKNFYNMPLAAVVTNFSKIQSDIKNIEAEMISTFAAASGKLAVVFNQMEACIVPESHYVQSGTPFNANVFLATGNRQSRLKEYAST